MWTAIFAVLAKVVEFSATLAGHEAEKAKAAADAVRALKPTPRPKAESPEDRARGGR